MGLIFSRNYEKIEKLFKEFRKKDYFSELTESKGGGGRRAERREEIRGGERDREGEWSRKRGGMVAEGRGER